MAQSLIQPKKQGNRKCSGVGVGGDREEAGGWIKFEKVGGVGTLLQLCRYNYMITKCNKYVVHYFFFKASNENSRLMC